MIHLENRGVLKISGLDACSFLNGLLTNEINAIKPLIDTAIYACLLSPQGKYLFDMFIFRKSETEFLLDCSFTDELFLKLSMYKLRSKVEIENLGDEYAVFSSNTFENGLAAFLDSRQPKMGFRIIAPKNTKTLGEFSEFEANRINLVIPEPEFDLIRDGDFALEGLFDEMGAIDFHKGCYVGQEMTSRMKRRGTLKQKLVGFEYFGEAPNFNTPILAEDWEIGKTRSTANGFGICLLRLDRFKESLAKGIRFFAGVTEIKIRHYDGSIS